MRKRFVASFATLVIGTGLALAQEATLIPAQLAPSQVAAADNLPAPAPFCGIRTVAAEAPEETPPPAHVEAKPEAPASAYPGSCAPVLPSAGAPVVAADESQDTTRIWAHADSLLWWFKDSPVSPPLLTRAGPPSLTGRLGQPGTQVVLGGGDIESQEHWGGNFQIGSWLDNDNTLGVEGRYFFLGQKNTTQTVTSNPGQLFLAIPHINTARIPPLPPPFQDAVVLPGQPQSGTLTLRQQLQDAEFNGLVNVASECNFRLDLMGGFRFLDLDEDLGLAVTTLPPQPPGFPAGAPTLIEGASDRVQNRFYGGQVGARGEYRMWNLFLNGTALLALGDMHESLTANEVGGFGLFPPAQVRLGRDRLAFVSEGVLNVGYQLASWARVSVGYDFLLVTDVARPGSSISEPINVPAPVVVAGVRTTVAFPPPRLSNDSFWAQGLNFGLEIRY
jgi:hypothetical protein